MLSRVLIISFLTTSFFVNSQQNQSVNFQFGGQTLVSAHYEKRAIKRNLFNLNFNIGLGLNENGDEQTGQFATYGLHTGIIGLIGRNKLYLETSLFSTTYFHGPVTFINLNGWVGLKFDPFLGDKGVGISLAYSPRLHTTYNGSDYSNIPISLKLCINI